MAAHMKPVIGLVGGIGSGKSTVAKLFASLGCGVIDADEIARRALDEPAVSAKLREWWGPHMIGSDGKVSRKAVAAVVFEKPSELAKLESLTHPVVLDARAALIRRYEDDPAIVAIIDDTPLLLEKGLEGGCDHIVFVRASRETRLARVRARGWSEEDLEKREKRQWPLDMKAGRAQDVIVNEAAESDCLPHVRRVLSHVIERHAQRR